MLLLEDSLSLFHHIHHSNNKHEVHHCGGAHVKVDPRLDYTIKHCKHQKHSINKITALGHATDNNFKTIEVVVKFEEKCSEGGWHLESGKLLI